MSDYNPNDLKSTLVYIKDRFGLEIFINQGRLTAVFSDLAPKLKKERNMVDRMSRIGIIKDFALYSGNSITDQKRIMSKAMEELTQSEFIRSDIATYYLEVLADVFDWEIRIDIPKEAPVAAAGIAIAKKANKSVLTSKELLDAPFDDNSFSTKKLKAAPVKKDSSNAAALKESPTLLLDNDPYTIIPYSSKLKTPNDFHNMYLYVNEEGTATTLISVYVDINEHRIYVPVEKYDKYKGVMTKDSVIVQETNGNKRKKIRVSKGSYVGITRSESGRSIKQPNSRSTKEITGAPNKKENSDTKGLKEPTDIVLGDDPYTIFPYSSKLKTPNDFHNMYLYVNEEGTATTLISVYVDINEHRIYVPVEKYDKYKDVMTKDSVIVQETNGNKRKKIRVSKGSYVGITRSESGRSIKQPNSRSTKEITGAPNKKENSDTKGLKEPTDIVLGDDPYTIFPYSSKLKTPNDFHNMYLYVNEEGTATTLISVYVDINEHRIYVPVEKYDKYKGVMTKDSVIVQETNGNKRNRIKVVEQRKGMKSFLRRVFKNSQ